MKKDNYEHLKEKLLICKNMSLNEIDVDEIDEISSVKIDRRKSSNERILDFLNGVKNPYIFNINGRIVKMSFSDSEKTADDCLTNVLKNLYR
ncbi:MAG: hypothetical protein E7166_03230 [Firmicutes bacterium]|nr:hypothetical protein [Bacillota bacterium]